MKRATMELGGHSPVVVFGDADPEKTADTIAAFKYRNAGQVCISPTRFYVQEPVYDRFLKRFTEYADRSSSATGWKRASPWGRSPIRAASTPWKHRHRREGSRRQDRHRRQAARQPGLFLRADRGHRLPDDCKLMTEEPFGPIAPIVTFKTFDEVVERANSLPFGLAAYAFTSSAQTATAIGDALEVGHGRREPSRSRRPETPFGGVKESGYGTRAASKAWRPI